MKLVIEINLDNDAFKPSPIPELQKILHDYYLSLNNDPPILESSLMDSNGNTVGEAEVYED